MTARFATIAFLTTGIRGITAQTAARRWTERMTKMYNNNRDVDANCCVNVPEPHPSLNDSIREIMEKACKAREMAFDIYKNLFGEMPNNFESMKVECANDALININQIEIETLDILLSVINGVGA